MRRALPAISCVVVLVILAGCGGGPGDGTSPLDTPTPADVPTDGPLADPPTGLDGSGIANSTRLVDTHNAALNNTSFTYRRTDTLTAVNGTKLLNSSAIGKYRTDKQTALLVQRYDTPQPPLDGENGTITQWINESAMTYRIATPSETEYGVFREIHYVSPHLGNQVERYYMKSDTVTVTSSGDNITLRFTTAPGEDIATGTLVNVTNRRVTVTMTESGRIEQYRVEYTGRLVNEPETMVDGIRTVRVTGVNATTVERPDWVSNAWNATNTSA
jgi:hypothetical protein